MRDIRPKASFLPYTTPTVVGLLCILTILTGTLVSACDSGGSNAASAEVLIPLKEGNQWKVDATGAYVNSVALEVTSDTTVRMRENEPNETDTRTLIVEERTDGFLIRGGLITPDDPGADAFISSDDPAMLLEYPVEDGDSYEHTDGEGSTYRVVVSRDAVSVPAGDYECLLYTISDPADGTVVREVWVKPGMGPVRLSRYKGEEVFSLTSTNVSP